MNSQSPSFSVRTATPDDAPQIVQLVESVYRGDRSREGWTTEADLLDGQRTDVPMILDLMKDSVFLLAEDGQNLLASVQIENKKDYAYIGMLSVDVRAQNLKLGRHMLEACETFAKTNWGLLETRITVIERRKELVNWYERRGFARTGRVVPFHSDPRFGIPKVEDLHLIEMSKPID